MISRLTLTFGGQKTDPLVVEELEEVSEHHGCEIVFGDNRDSLLGDGGGYNGGDDERREDEESGRCFHA